MCVNDVIIEIYKFELISSYLVQGLTKEYKVWSVILFQVDNHQRPNKLNAIGVSVMPEHVQVTTTK